MKSFQAQVDDPTGAVVDSEPGSQADSLGLMKEFSIIRAGRYYHCEGYRYERLADAVAYAEVVRARQSRPADSLSIARSDTVESPSASDLELMIQLSITFENYRFAFAGFHYDRLIDAVNYARDHGRPYSATA